jgi:uncharacterized membrane protein HdeD (DUF308 family)
MNTPIGRRPLIRKKIASVWWIVLMRGLIGILLGMALFSQVSMNVVILAKFMAIYWLADGLFMVLLGFGVRMPGGEGWWKWMVGRGVLGIVAGFVVLGLEAADVTHPILLAWLLAATAIVSGGIDLVTNARLRREVEDEWAMTISAVAQMVFGVLLALSPIGVLRLIGPFIGIIAIAAGIGMIFFSIRTMRKLGEPLQA